MIKSWSNPKNWWKVESSKVCGSNWSNPFFLSVSSHTLSLPNWPPESLQQLHLASPASSCSTSNLSIFCWVAARAVGKNKMKPTNPNADTYVEKQRCNTYLSQFPANPLVEHTDLTRWGDTLVGHPCLTLLRYALVRHSCMTLWFDTLVWHSSETLLLDTLVRHFLLDTLPCHSCKTLLFNTLVGHFLLDTSYLTLFWETLTWQSCETFLLDWHSSPTLLLDTLVRHSYLALL